MGEARLESAFHQHDAVEFLPLAFVHVHEDAALRVALCHNHLPRESVGVCVGQHHCIGRPSVARACSKLRKAEQV